MYTSEVSTAINDQNLITNKNNLSVVFSIYNWNYNWLSYVCSKLYLLHSLLAFFVCINCE